MSICSKTSVDFAGHSTAENLTMANLYKNKLRQSISNANQQLIIGV